MVWIANYPTETTIVSGSVDQIRDNWEAIEEWTDIEHVGFGSIATCGVSAVGLHIPINYGIVGYDVSATPSCSGALSYDSTLGIFTISSSSFERIPITTYWSQTRAIGGIHLIENEQWTSLYFPIVNNYTFDTLGEWDSSYSTFTVKSTGFYLIMAMALFPYGTYNKGLQILKNSIATCQGYKYGKIHRVVRLYDIGVLNAESSISVKCYQNSGSSIYLTNCGIYIIKLS